jgi:hypothetical protein
MPLGFSTSWEILSFYQNSFQNFDSSSLNVLMQFGLAVDSLPKNLEGRQKIFFEVICAFVVFSQLRDKNVIYRGSYLRKNRTYFLGRRVQTCTSCSCNRKDKRTIDF